MKIRLTIAFLSIIFLTSSTLAQELSIGRKIYSSADSANYLIDKQRLNYYYGCVFDDDLFEFIRNEAKDVVAYKNGEPVDTLRHSNFIIKAGVNSFKPFQGKIYVLGRTSWSNHTGDTLGIYEFNQQSNRFSDLKFTAPNFIALDLVGGEFYGFFDLPGERKVLYGLNMTSFQLRKKNDLISSISTQSGIAELFNYGSDSLLLIMTGEGNADGFDNIKFFKYHTKNNVVNEVTEKISEYCWLQNENNTKMTVTDAYSFMFPSSLLVFGNSCEKQSQWPFLLGENLEIIEEGLLIAGYPEGEIYRNGKLSGTFVRSITDEKRDVYVKISELPSIQLMRSLKKTFTAGIISESELKDLTKHSLSILEKSIYARYSQKFLDPYWEAFFNQYQIYRDAYFVQRKSRVVDVEGLFSTEDKNNLSLIRNKLKKRDK